FAIDTFKVRLGLDVTRKKPFYRYCQECSHKSTDLTWWNFFQGPFTCKHNFPFSFLLLGHLPATTKGSLFAIGYVLHVTLSPKSGQPIMVSRILDIKRSLNPVEPARHSIRVFPPANFVANCTLPSVIHPIGEATVSIRINGVVKRNWDTKMLTKWKLKGLKWRLEERQKVTSPACARRAAKLRQVEGRSKRITHQCVRTIGKDDVKSGWKADYYSPGGSIEIEFPFRITYKVIPTQSAT
ncbi:hypothetical protein DL98DRAFT_629366, partial [Cadophora sp. DSE1049]